MECAAICDVLELVDQHYSTKLIKLKPCLNLSSQFLQRSVLSDHFVRVNQPGLGQGIGQGP
jgi:hypothetical protein